ncbi:hypothetical protein [uncultured Cellulomonas sp.]|uniref:hypothetical protein n=1 Tax=uncultured Cellulomonas sp. TaxID=189682 RepID=UPI002624D5CA|nr:hypothetical protein [uncultured Cellulomonas sp.]
MSMFITADSISDAWVETLESVNSEQGGTATHLMVTVSSPQQGDDPTVSSVINRVLLERDKHGVLTVANTLFPISLYNNPGFSWSPELTPDDGAALDEAAAELYAAYLDSLPTLKRVRANSGGTYFARMVSWPGKTATGTNQLSNRIEALRKERSNRRRASNASDIAVAGEADGADEAGVGGLLEQYAVSDTRTRGFPCLVHIDISVRNGALSLLGVYRHWHLITRGYGNLVGLARLQQFLCQQTGFATGELAIVAGHANAEHSDYSGRSGVRAILDEVATARSNGTAQGLASA